MRFPLLILVVGLVCYSALEVEIDAYGNQIENEDDNLEVQQIPVTIDSKFPIDLNVYYDNGSSKIDMVIEWITIHHICF